MTPGSGAVPTGSGWLTSRRADGTWADGDGTGEERDGYGGRCRWIEPGTLGVTGRKERWMTSGCRRDGEDGIIVAEWRMWGTNKKL